MAGKALRPACGRTTTPASGIQEGSLVNAPEPEPPEPLTPSLFVNVPLPPDSPELLLVAPEFLEPPVFPYWLSVPLPLLLLGFPPLGLVAAGSAHCTSDQVVQVWRRRPFGCRPGY